MSLRHNSISALLALALLGSAPIEVLAQADVITGRVTDDRGSTIAGASVLATSNPGSISRPATTSADGRYTITFASGGGDYWIVVTAIGFSPRRVELRRVAEREVLVADVRLARAGAVLDTMKVTAPRKRGVADTTGIDAGGGERRVDVDAATLEQLADLALLAGGVPGVQIVPGADGAPTGYSVLGLGPEQNETTLNGMKFDGSALPRDAAFDAALAVSPYDVSRGGFSGAQLALRSRPPSNLTLRANSIALDYPRLQFTDPAGRALGQEFTALSLGGVITSPIVLDRAFLHVAYQLGRRGSDLNHIGKVDASGLRAAGLSGDSVARFFNVLSGLRVPAELPGLPSQRAADQGLVYGSVDFMSPSASTAQAFKLTFVGSWNRQAPAGVGSLGLVSHGGERLSTQGALQLRHTRNLGTGVLSETQLGVSVAHADGSRYLDLPSATVRINSVFPDGEQRVGVIVFGGASGLDRAQETSALSLMNSLSWFSEDRAHRLRLSTELSRESLDERLATNSLGTFQFNSLSDLELGIPVAFRRQVSSPRHDFANYVAGLALGDAFAPSERLQLNYGVRVDATRFSTAPTYNPLVERDLGVRNDATPNRVRMSPRLGFSYVSGTERRVSATEGGARDPRVTLRGGVGVFQGLPGTPSLAALLDNTGLPTGAQQLTCLGPAVPRPDWAAYGRATSSIPMACADGTTASVFADARPAVALFAPDYSAPRSVRSNLQWSSQVLDGRFNARADATYSLNLDQGGSVDLNFTPQVRFALAGEGSRPVFVPMSSIATANGAVSSNAARRSESLSRVTELRSDLRSEARQFQLSISPAGFRSVIDWSATYVYSNLRDEQYGFASTGGDPRTREWGRSIFDARHQLVYTLGYNLFDAFRLSWAGSVRSGTPYTPMIGGDVNGDGYENDRAFVYDPSRMGDAASGAAMAKLLRESDAQVRACLASTLERIATRGSCEGPWTTSASLSVAFNPVRWWRSNRLDVLVQVSNPLGAADLMLNGSDHLRGWGQAAIPDNTLYYVRGFDAASASFRYDVNPRFGSTSPATSTIRAPVVLTAVVRVDVGPTRERQLLTQQLDRGRSAAGTKLSEAALRSLYATGGVFNPMGAILRVSDSIGLSGRQADSITLLNSRFATGIAPIWNSFAKTLAALPDDYDTGVVNALYVRARTETIDLLAEVAPRVRDLLTADQLRTLPTYLVAHLDPRYLATIRRGTAGLGLTFLPGVSAPRVNGNVGGSVAIGR